MCDFSPRYAYSYWLNHRNSIRRGTFAIPLQFLTWVTSERTNTIDKYYLLGSPVCSVISQTLSVALICSFISERWHVQEKIDLNLMIQMICSNDGQVLSRRERALPRWQTSRFRRGKSGGIWLLFIWAWVSFNISTGKQSLCRIH